MYCLFQTGNDFYILYICGSNNNSGDFLWMIFYSIGILSSWNGYFHFDPAFLFYFVEVVNLLKWFLQKICHMKMILHASPVTLTI
ncbi:hypothetical protein BDB00DRAFT_824143 [Zychaea mexicana]|uniref:uncharacterized protein n=1 Tax=Zychaea mexicana TaxID=64656 RepID=UPI0022FF35D4|nr:uncharacterized protein BDB00DRAFT_824143 [Zychaea mexicana]KAI9493253.1 hypothetical protein BDB00DRAFT_824143 [Zychaea mexicana]